MNKNITPFHNKKLLSYTYDKYKQPNTNNAEVEKQLQLISASDKIQPRLQSEITMLGVSSILGKINVKYCEKYLHKLLGIKKNM